jgi:hypothetical protein
MDEHDQIEILEEITRTEAAPRDRIAAPRALREIAKTDDVDLARELEDLTATK